MLARDARRPIRDDVKPRDDYRPRDEIRPRDEVKSRDEFKPRDQTRQREDKRPVRDDIRPRDEKPARESSRPRDDRYQDKQKDEGRRYRDDDRRPYRNRDDPEDRDRPFKPERHYDDDRVEDKRPPPSAPEGQQLVKPNGHGIFSQPRMPPKIKRPVPANEKQKYDYVPVATTKPPPKSQDDDEYYDYEEDETSKPSSSGKSSAVQQRPRPEPVEKEKFRPTRPNFSSPASSYKAKKRPIDYDDDYYYDHPPKSQKYAQKAEKPKKPLDDLDEYDYEVEPAEKDRRSYNTPKPEEDRILPARAKDVRMNVKVIKRPFLPSRGGNPYLPRGLQPVAGKNLSSPPPTTPKPPPTTTTTTTTSTTTTTTTTTPEPTTVSTTEKIVTPSISEEDEYEYFDEDEDVATEPLTTTSTTEAPRTNPPEITTESQSAETATSYEEKAKNVAAKVLRVYNENYEAIKDKLETTLTPGDYLKSYLNPTIPPLPEKEQYIPKPEISKPYTATGKPLIPENISIKQNLADSVEADYDDAINEAAPAYKYIPSPAPTQQISHLRNVPNTYVLPADRDYTFSRFRGSYPNIDPQYSASELTSYRVNKRPQINVSLRTPNSFYIQPNHRLTPTFSQDDMNSRPPRQLVYRPVAGLGSYF